MLKQRNILIYARTAWFANYAKTIVEMAQVLAGHNRVLYLDYQFTWKDCLLAFFKPDPASSPARILGLKKRLRLVGPPEQRVLLLTPPPVLPINWLKPGPFYNFLQRLNTAWVNRTLRHYLARLKMEQDLIHINAFNPDYGRFTLPQLEAVLHVYYCYDKIEAAHWAARHGALAEKIFLGQVDGAVFSSKGLLEAKAARTASAKLVQNGVNFDRFHRAYLPKATGKTIIYIGALDFRINYPLLEAAVSALNQYNFHFVGPVKETEAARRLAAFKQVRFTDSVGVEKLPELLKGCAAGIIPFEENEFTRGIYPLKVNEYLAAGLPVVSTQFGDMSDFSSILPVVEDATAFQKALVEAIEQDEPAKRKARVDFARQNAWSARVRELSYFLKELEEKKKGG